jgi:hypothetical protein
MGGFKLKTQLQAAALSYLRAAISCAAALYMSGITDPKILANAFIAGALAPIMRAISPNDKAFGAK